MKGNILSGIRGWLAGTFLRQNALPCVGIVVLGGCLTFLVAPDETKAPGTSDDGGNGFPTVIIDPGHGGNDDGAKGNGLIEKQLTLDLAERTEKLLKMAGFPTELTRRGDVYVALDDRARFANRYEDALFVSIHFNKDGDSSSTGVESFYAKEKVPIEQAWTWVGFFSKPDQIIDNGENLCGAVHASIATRTEAKNRGIRPRDLYVVRHTRCPAVLVEGGFMSNAFEAQLLKSEDYKQRLAMGIAEGVMTYQKSRPRAVPAVPRLAFLGR